MSKRYLVTGGTGFLGSALVRSLLAGGHAVRVLDDDSRGSIARLEDVRDQLEFVAGDVRDAETVAAAVRGVDAVCHLAFVNGTEFFYSMPEVVLDVGVKGMTHVLDACQAHGVRELVLVSSSEVYQEPPRIPTAEDAPLVIPDVLNPRYSYAAGKIISEVMAIHYGRKAFDRVLVVRPHNVFGPQMGWEHVVPQLVLRMHRACEETPAGPVPFTIQGPGTQTRAFIYIDDFVAGLMRVIERGEHLGIYHVGTMQEVTIADLTRMVAAYFGREIEIVPTAAALGGTPRRCPDIAKLQRLGFSPAFSLEDGLRRTADWYVAHAAEAPERAYWKAPANEGEEQA